MATKLAHVVHDIHRLVRPTGTPVENPTEQEQPDPADEPATPPDPRRTEPELAGLLLTAVATGIGIAVGQRLLDILLPRWNR